MTIIVTDLTETADIRRSTATLSAMPPLVTNAAGSDATLIDNCTFVVITGKLSVIQWSAMA